MSAEEGGGPSSTSVHAHSFAVTQYVEKRAAQIADLLAVVDNSRLVAGEVTKGPRTAAQRLPRWMRRRAMSHDIRRFPRKMRDFAALFLDSKHLKKAPSRFARRRPSNLLLNYIRRQREHAWLETHIWHAKRFHMINRWGYRLPDRSFQRNFRPIYRAAKRHAVVRDKSYLTCFLLSSPSREILTRCLGPLLCPPSVAPNIRSVFTFDGRKECTTLLYAPGAYPHGAIGPARFMWSEGGGRSLLSLWVHPSMRATTLQHLTEALGLEKMKGEDEEGWKEKLSTPSSIVEWRAARSRIATDEYTGREGVTLTDLRDQMARIRLCGPRSMRVAREALRLVKPDNDSGECEDMIVKKEDVEEDAKKNLMDEHGLHNSAFSRVFARCTPRELQDGSVYSLLVEDPRCARPIRRGLLERKVRPEEDPDEVSTPAPSSAIWSRSTRMETLEARLSNAEFNKLRGEKIGGVMETDAKIPCLVIVRNEGEAPLLSGVDVVVPAGFGSDLWLSMQLRTARASGVRDELAAHAESSIPSFPEDAVDCTAGVEETRREEKEKEEKHLRRPWNRRPAFWKRLSVKHPFAFAWPELVKDWSKKEKGGGSKEEPNPFVARDIVDLMAIGDWLNHKADRERTKKAEAALDVFSKDGGLIPVQLNALSRGRPRRLALICLPTTGDLESRREGRKRGIRMKVMQPPHGVSEEELTETEEQRRILREEGREEEEEREHEIEVDKEAKKSWQDEMWKDVVSIEPAAREKPISLKQMFPELVTSRQLKRKLQNRKKKESAKRRKTEAASRAERAEVEETKRAATAYRLSASREICGRVLRGDFSFTSARGAAIGLVAAPALRQIRDNGGIVLFRNTTSRYYHAARVTVLQRTMTL